MPAAHALRSYAQHLQAGDNVKLIVITTLSSCYYLDLTQRLSTLLLEAKSGDLTPILQFPFPAGVAFLSLPSGGWPLIYTASGYFMPVWSFHRIQIDQSPRPDPTCVCYCNLLVMYFFFLFHNLLSNSLEYLQKTVTGKDSAIEAPVTNIS